MEKFVRLREVLTPSGVYLLLRHGKVVYVGKSLNLFARLSNHYTNLQRKRAGKPQYANRQRPTIDFDDVMIRFVPVDELDKEEVKLIQKHLPEHNVHHNIAARDLSHIPAFQELLRRARADRGPTLSRRPVGFQFRRTPRKTLTFPRVAL